MNKWDWSHWYSGNWFQKPAMLSRSPIPARQHGQSLHTMRHQKEVCWMRLWAHVQLSDPWTENKYKLLTCTLVFQLYGKLRTYRNGWSKPNLMTMNWNHLLAQCLLFQCPQYPWELPQGCSGKEFTCQCRRCKRRKVNPWIGEIPWSRQWQPTPESRLEKFHGQRSLAGYGPWGCKESDMTECARIHTH